MEAFEINTVEWNSKYSSLANSKRRDIMSSINTFTTSLSDKLRIGGTNKENILTYVPAIVYIMYDGYYIYSPTYVPQTITNNNGVQLFYYDTGGYDATKITASATQNIGGNIVSGEPIYYFDSSIDGAVATGTYDGKSFTTNVKYASKIYKHVLKTFVPYTTIYNNYVINYTLDDYIRIYGGNQSKEGYVIDDFGATNEIEIPVNSIDEVKFNGETITPEILTENIAVRDSVSEEIQIKEYTYVYNSDNDKRYYDSSAGKFFMVDKNYVKVFLTDVQPSSAMAEYKKVLIRTSEFNYDYLELYQLLNGEDTSWWYKGSNNDYIEYTNVDSSLTGLEKYKDCSAINYYVETCEFNHWLDYNSINIDYILSLKRDEIIKDINNNLNLSMSNYSANSGIDYKLPELTDKDWDQALSNISMITFLQGQKIGLKTYNNYVVVTSTENNEYVSEDSLYYLGRDLDKYYHRYNCSSIEQEGYIAYRNTEFKAQKYSYKDSTGHTIEGYYYKHIQEYGGEIYNQSECFDCIVNRNNIDTNVQDEYDGLQEIALARERYVQMSKVNLIIELNKKIIVTFDKNGGNCSTESKEVTYNSTYGTLPEASKAGCEFAGWYTQKTLGSKIESPTKVTATGDHTLYARWKSRVTFDANGGNCNTTSMDVVQGNIYGTLPEPEDRTGYDFLGWYTELTEGSSVTATTIVPETGNHTLYAHWEPESYMITFDANGGSCSTSSKAVTYNSEYGTLPTPTRTGYDFLGWYTEITGGSEVYETTIVDRTENHTLYAHWKRITYTIAYDVNGGSGAPESQQKYYGTDLTLSSTTPTRTGYTFLGWSTSSSATTAEYQPGGTYTANSSATLYAVWSLNTYAVTYNANGGSGAPNSQTKYYGIDLTLNSTTPTRTGYTFLGWSTSSTATTAEYQPGGTYTANSSATLYAVWSQITYTITYNANGGSGAPASQTKYYGTNLTLSSQKPTRTNYTFLGWSTSSTATTATYQAGGTYTANSDATLYAVWKLSTIPVTSVTLNVTGDQWIPYKKNGSNGTLNLTATVSPSNATNKTVTWSSSNTSVATVNNGAVKATGAGKVTITATAGGKSASVDVYVYNAAIKAGWTMYMYPSNTNYNENVHDNYTGINGGEALMIISKAGTNWYYMEYYNGTYTGNYQWGSRKGDAYGWRYFYADQSKINKQINNYGAW